jgi:hypothetical protein
MNDALKTTRLKPLLARAILAAGLVCAAGGAHAALMVSAAVGGAATGNNYVNFDNLALGAAGGASNGVTVSFGANGAVVAGPNTDTYAAPYISGSNGSLFGDATVSGADSTRYISTGNTSATLLFPGMHHYLGMLWGSVDTFNRLEFFSGATSLGFLTGSNIVAAANGDQGVMGTYYANITSDLAFDRVVASSSDYAFEFDNVAYDTSSTPNGVPEPAALGLLGLGLLGTGFVRRRKASQS